MMTVRRSYKYRLYRSGRRNKRLHQTIDIAGLIWNHSVALCRRYYRLFGKPLSESRLKAHNAKLRMKTARFAHWKLLGSQAVQDVAERLGKAYQRFFKHKGGLPRFRKVKKYRSFTLKKKAGWKLLGDNKIKLLDKTYKFVKHRDIGGEIKTVTVKRDSLNQLWVIFSVIETIHIPEASTGKSGGFDFGLKTFLTDDKGRPSTSPQYFKAGLNDIRQANRKLSRKRSESHNRGRAKRKLAQAHLHIEDKRRDHHFKLAHELCDEYDVMFFEDLNLDGMKRLWGRKVSDLGFAQFLDILEWVALKRGKQVHRISRWEATSQTCSDCSARQKIDLHERRFNCPACGLSLDRDHNAARNIKRVGTSTLGLKVC